VGADDADLEACAELWAPEVLRQVGGGGGGGGSGDAAGGSGGGGGEIPRAVAAAAAELRGRVFPTITTSDDMAVAVVPGSGVGPGTNCPPRHPTQFVTLIS